MFTPPAPLAVGPGRPEGTARGGIVDVVVVGNLVVVVVLGGR